jgi:hypothetical protein
MNRNVGSTDRSLRTVVGAVSGAGSIATLLGLVPVATVAAPVLGVVAAVMLGTALVGTCPLYSALGVDSCSERSNPY